MILGRTPPKTRPAIEEPRKHVIEEYQHRAQLVTCVCGWHGSSANPAGAPSAWTQHVRDSRTTAG